MFVVSIAYLCNELSSDVKKQGDHWGLFQAKIASLRAGRYGMTQNIIHPCAPETNHVSRVHNVVVIL